MYITRAFRHGNSMSITLPRQMCRALEINHKDYFVLMLTEANTIELKALTETLQKLTFSRRASCA